MIEVEDPAGRPAACAACGPLIWMLSARTRRWVAWLQVDATTVRLHPCRSAQDPVTWREMPRRPGPVQVEINARGRRLAEQLLRGEDEDRDADGDAVDR